jgi:tetratricopeptide (TPR) repeat protein
MEIDMREILDRPQPTKWEAPSDVGGGGPGVPTLGPSGIQDRVKKVIEDRNVEDAVISIEMPTADDVGKAAWAGDTRPFWIPFGKPGDGGTSPITKRVETGRLKAIDEVIDELAEAVLEEIRRNDLLVVLLFDESRSLLEDRKTIMQKINRVVSDLKRKMKEKGTARLKWAVVSYSKEPRLWLSPTENIDEVVAGALRVGQDETGIENVCAAISFSMRTLGSPGKRMFVVVITDEEGNDTHNEKAFMQALEQMQATKARLFVFGRESQFQQGWVFEWLRDAKGERLGPWFPADRGLESCQQEFFTSDWLFNHHRGERLIGSGFGCWSLTTLAELTKGVFFILADVPSPYDEDKLEKFEPEWVTPAEYTARNTKSKLRMTMRKVIDGWKQMDPPPWLYQFDALKAERDEALAKAEKALKFVEGAIDEMEGLRGRRSAEKFAKMRWQANYDLAMAELYKFRFMLRDYISVLRSTRTAGFPKPRPNQKFNVYRILYNNALTEPRTGRRGLREWELAKKAFEQIINSNEYDGTPWAEVAKHEKRTTAPIWVFPGFHVQIERPPG